MPGQRLSSDAHQSTTDPEARLYRKGRGRDPKLSFMGGTGQELLSSEWHILSKNRNRRIVDGCVTQANRHDERVKALTMIENGRGGQRTASSTTRS